MHERSIFMEALEIDDPREREAHLARVCGADVRLRARVEALLRRHQEAASCVLDRDPDFDLTATADASSTPESPGISVGSYRLMEAIGEGGMGVVYVAEQTQPVRRKVALKIIKPGMDTKQIIARFEAERQALAMMDHPNIAHVLDGGATGSGRPYFVMELVRGIPITEYCDREQLTIPERLDLFVLVCRAVQHAHQKGIIHRDLKPSNILVTVIDGVAVPKVIDFGVAKATGQSLTDRTIYTAFQQFIGTPLYTSPEQADLSGMDVDTRSDIYSLGVLLYELLTGTTPFDAKALKGAAFDELRRIIRENEPPKPSTRLSSLGQTRATVSANRKADPHHLDRTLRGELDWIVMKALEKDRRRRYETANDFAADIMRYLTDQPVEACPPSAWYRFMKFARRNRAALVSATLFTTAISVGLATSLWFAVVAMMAEKKRAAALAEAKTNYAVAEMRRAEAVAQERQAKSLLTRSLIRSGTQQLEEGSALGLFDLINAHAMAEHTPELREAAARLWAVGIAPLDDSLVTVLEGRFGTFSPDGLLIATALDDVVTLWETTSWRRRGTPLNHGPGKKVTHIAFSPDGSRLATLTDEGGARLWDVATGQAGAGPLRDEMKDGAHFPTNSLDFSPDGKLVACGALSGEVRIWDAATGTVRVAIQGHAGPVDRIAFSPNGMVLATGSHDATARLWDVATGEPISPPLRQEDMVHAMAFSPDGTLLATSSGFAKTRLWEVPSGRLHSEPLTTGGWVLGLAFSPDSKLLATGDTDWTAQLWDTATGRPWGKPLRHEGRVFPVRFSPDGRLLATASMNGLTRLWDVETQRVHGLPLPADARRQGSSSFSPDGRLLAVGGKTGTRVWRVTQKPWTATFEHTDPVWAIDLSPDGRRLATASGAAVRIWDVGTGQSLRHPLVGVAIDLANYPFMPSAVRFSPDGSLLAVIDSPRTVRLLDAATGHPVGQPMNHPAKVRTLAFAPDGRRLVTGTHESKAEKPTIRLFETTAQTLLVTQPLESLCLAISPSGRQLAVGHRSWMAEIWELGDALKHNRDLHQGEWCLSLDYSANGSRLATGTTGGLVHLWAASTGEPRGPSVRLDGPVKKLELSPDGKLLATATFDLWERQHGPVRLWDLTLSSPYSSLALPQSFGTLSLALTADGRWLAIGQVGGQARLLRMPMPPVATRELQLRTWVALGTRASDGEYQTIAVEEWKTLQHELRSTR